jgi:hypothetical protein
MTQSEIVHHKGGGTTFAGPDAVAYFRARTLASSIKLFMRTGIIPTRGVTGPVMLRIATEITGKAYKRGQYQAAYDDVVRWADTMKAALPVEDNRQPNVGEQA